MPNDPEWIFIGSATECQVRVTGSGVAAQHARACLDRGRMRIEDLGSPAGTALNSPDRRISVSWLEPADLIYVGSLSDSGAPGIRSAAQARPRCRFQSDP